MRPRAPRSPGDALDLIAGAVSVAIALAAMLAWTLVVGLLAVAAVEATLGAPTWAERVREREARMIAMAGDVATFHRREGRWPDAGDLYCDLDPGCVAPQGFLVFDSVEVMDGRPVLASRMVGALFSPNPMPHVALHLDIETRALRERRLRHAWGWALREGPLALLLSALALGPWAVLAAWAIARRQGGAPPAARPAPRAAARARAPRRRRAPGPCPSRARPC